MNSDSDIVFSKNLAVEQLCNVTIKLIDEAEEIVSSLEYQEFSVKQLQRLSVSLLKTIDNNLKVIEAIAHVNNLDVVKAKVRLEQSIDKCYVNLTATYNEISTQIYTDKVTCDDVISYIGFIGELANKLLMRASQEVKQQELLSEDILITEEQKQRYNQYL